MRPSPTWRLIGNDHMETFFLTSVPTFAILAGERSRADSPQELRPPIHQGLAEDLLDKLVNAVSIWLFQDAVLDMPSRRCMNG